MNYILECLQQVKPEERRKEAERLLNIFSHPARTEIPHNLRQVVMPLIKQPRDNSIIIEDFIKAIKEDFKY